jgi:hypothetical protein
MVFSTAPITALAWRASPGLHAFPVMLEGGHGHLVLIIEVSVDAAFGEARGIGPVGKGSAGAPESLRAGK